MSTMHPPMSGLIRPAIAAWEAAAAAAAKTARNVAEYSPYANLRDALHAAAAALSEIEALTAETRERLEAGIQPAGSVEATFCKWQRDWFSHWHEAGIKPEGNS